MQRDDNFNQRNSEPAELNNSGIDARFGLEEPKISESETNITQSVEEMLLERKMSHIRRLKMEKFVSDLPKAKNLTKVRPNIQANNIFNMNRIQFPELYEDMSDAQMEAHSKQMARFEFYRKRNKYLERNFGPVASGIMKGKLGIDSLFLFFGITGIVLIPIFFFVQYQRRLQRFQEIEELAKKVDPKFAPDIDEDSLEAMSEKDSVESSWFDADEARKEALKQIEKQNRMEEVKKRAARLRPTQD